MTTPPSPAALRAAKCIADAWHGEHWTVYEINDAARIISEQTGVDALAETLETIAECYGCTFHEWGCSEDETCDCAHVKMVTSALKAYRNSNQKPQ